MKLLITGTDGYIGSVLAPMLLSRGHSVVGLDTGFYREGWLYSDAKAWPTLPKLLNKDLREITTEDLAGFDAVVHLAELSNDPLGANNPKLTHAINHKGSIQLASLARDAGIQRFVYTSSCSVYGAGDGELPIDEHAEVDPQTAYAECKVLVENDLIPMSGQNFCPVVLRNATAYGASPRMRFDIVLNNLCGVAFTEGKIVMTSDGTPWRPLVHVQDICSAIDCALNAPADAVSGEIFNVGHNGDNFRVREIAEIVAQNFPGCETTFGDSGGDNRSYRVCFDKIASQLPGFACQWTADKGAKQLFDLFTRIQLTADQFNGRYFTRLKMLKHLIDTKQLDPEFFWR